MILAVFKDTLDHAASKRVAAEGYDTGEEAVQNMQNTRGGDALDDLLNDVIAILVAHTAHDLSI